MSETVKYYSFVMIEREIFLKKILNSLKSFELREL